MNIKQSILGCLEENRGEYISGESLSERFNVTRQAVWKNIKSLEKDGYVISSVPNKGYMLDKKCDLLSSSIISQKTGIDVICYDCVTSTNTVAKEQFFKCGECIIVADSQTDGKNKQGGKFASPQRKGIYMTIALPINCSLENCQNLREICARAVADCIQKTCGKVDDIHNCKVDDTHNCGKVVNIQNVDEIFVDDKKVCGILIECNANLATRTITAAFIGIGIYTADPGSPFGYIVSPDTRNTLISEIYLSIKKELTFI